LIAQPDAAADPQQAERWYRAWYDIAGRQGLVMDPDRLQRLIRSMN